MNATIVLASASPRRRELLARMGTPFIIDAAEVDETIAGDAESAVKALALRKAQAVAPRHPGCIILAADTVVDCDGVLGKPRDEAEAARMLSRLSGRWHDVYTGICTIYAGQTRCEAARTRVHFTRMTTEDIARYVATGESLDKAGAYGIQGMAGMFIDEIQGCPHNVMGLPLALTKRLLTF